MENNKCVIQVEGLSLYFHRKRKAMGSFQVDKNETAMEKERETNTINKLGAIYVVMFMSLYIETALELALTKMSIHTQ